MFHEPQYSISNRILSVYLNGIGYRFPRLSSVGPDRKGPKPMSYRELQCNAGAENTAPPAPPSGLRRSTPWREEARR